MAAGAFIVARVSYKAGASTQKAKELEAANEQWHETADKITEARDAGHRAEHDPDLMSDDGFKRPPP